MWQGYPYMTIGGNSCSSYDLQLSNIKGDGLEKKTNSDTNHIILKISYVSYGVCFSSLWDMYIFHQKITTKDNEMHTMEKPQPSYLCFINHSFYAVPIDWYAWLHLL